MNNNKPCCVEKCKGTYQEKTIAYANLKAVGTDDYKISVNEFHKRLNKKDYNKIIASNCNVCGDSLDNRLHEFIQQLGP